MCLMHRHVELDGGVDMDPAVGIDAVICKQFEC